MLVPAYELGGRGAQEAVGKRKHVSCYYVYLLFFFWTRLCVMG